MSEREVWKPLPLDPKRYEVSNRGRVRSLTRTRNGEPLIRVPVPDKDGYQRISLFSRGDPRRGNYAVARLVLLTFKGEPPEPKMQVCHENGVRDDNRIENLRWGTQLENMRDRDRHGGTARGSANGRAVLTGMDVIEIRKRYQSGETVKRIAEDYGLKEGTIHSAIHKNWKHLK